MLTSLRLIDWKSFGDGDAIPFGPLTLFVGPNGSGKSNVIDALRFLQGAALDLPLGDVLRGRYEGQREVWPGIRGFAVEASRTGRSGFELETSWHDGGSTSEHRIAVLTGANIGLGDEWFQGGDIQYTTVMDFITIRDPESALNRALDGTRMAIGQVAQIDRAAPRAAGNARALQKRMRETIFLDVQPIRMRDYRPESATQLGVNAENVSAILYRLSKSDGLQDVVDWLGELSAPAIERIEFDHTQLGEVMMFLVERGGARVSARSMSDGTLRFLGMIVALLTVPEGSIIVVEEPDVGLHPSRIHLLASLLEDVVKRRSLQVIATTHSPTLLSHLSAEALADVVAFGRDPDDGTTIARRIGDLPHFGTLTKSEDLEHLVSTGWLERAL